MWDKEAEPAVGGREEHKERYSLGQQARGAADTNGSWIQTQACAQRLCAFQQTLRKRLVERMSVL